MDPERGAGPGKRYALIGLGARSALYREALTGRFADRGRLVACLDPNPGRLRLAVDRVRASGGAAPAAYGLSEVDAMLAQQRPDTVIVTSVDATHDEHVCRALLSGCDVIVEKPMATTADKCRRILQAARQSGRRCSVAFNYRYSPVRGQLKQLLRSGSIGDILSVDFHWLLDTRHGADYFRRWHSHRDNSGGLLVHKATHHFDLINWWLEAVPRRVFARGRRAFYVPHTARRLGLTAAGARCHGCADHQRCDFSLSLADSQELRQLYLDQESHDGYLRDRCVFRDDIDIEDSMSVSVAYDTGASLSYSLNAFCSWEGYQVAFNGSRGRIEHSVVETTDVTDMGDARGAIAREGSRLRVLPLHGEPCDVEPETSQGGHGGGDERMLDDLLGNSGPDPLGRAADHQSGINSVLVGAAANLSMRTGADVRVDVRACAIDAGESRL